MRHQRQVALTVLLALLVVMAGCSGGSNSASDGSDAGNGGSGAAEATQTAGAVSGSGGGGTDAAKKGTSVSESQTNFAARRELIRTGTVTLRVDDFTATETNLTAAVRRQGGFVSDTTQEVHGHDNETWTTGTLVLRVPKENFSALYDRVKAEGDVQHSTTATQDVTGKVVDLEARLKNLRAERDRLRTLYQKANETEDVLRVGQELSQTQEQIERLQAQLRVLRNRVAYSTITVNVSEPRPEFEPTRKPAWYETSVVTAFLDSVDGVVVVLRATFVGAAYAAPYVIVFGLPLAGAAILVHHRRRL